MQYNQYFNVNDIKFKVYDNILSTPEVKKGLSLLTKEIIERCKIASNEATIVGAFESLLYKFLKDTFNFDFLPEKEEKIDTITTSAKGRLDSRFGAFIIEYKHHSKLKTEKQKNSAVDQISTYMEAHCQNSDQDISGLITDGTQAKFLTFNSTTGLTQTSFEDLNLDHIERLIRNIFLLEKTALNPQNLVKDFSGQNGVAYQLARTLFATLEENITHRSIMLFNEWKALFKLAHDDVSKQAAIEERKKALADVMQIEISTTDNETEYKALYAIQTAYAIIVKIIAFKTIAHLTKQDYLNISGLTLGHSEQLRSTLNNLEEGAIFKDLMFKNLLEGDFFAWYCTVEQWNDEIADSVKKVFFVLSEYEDHKIFQDETIKVQDLFKNLYMSIIPEKVRHSLGEFYTPPWLADNLITDCIQDKRGWTALDPCCGSGTFITILIKKVLNECSEKSDKEKLKNVISRIKGIDLNPLAVLSARINYFINISHLINDEPIDIPIYLGDASYVPEKLNIGDVSCFSYAIQTLKGELKIEIPVSAIKDQKRFANAMTEVEKYIHFKNEAKVAATLLAIIDERDRTDTIIGSIEDLAIKLVDLERNNWNGIWARIITNFLTTANLEKFDFIFGNPPWIDWKNLPLNYREKIKSLCIDRNMFSGDSITGGINLNVCALITNVVADNWLKNSGTLGFLMPENMIFQQSYDGFRNLKLTSGKRLFFQEFYDWTKAGHPFKPVQYKFLSYIMSFEQKDYSEGINVKQFVKLNKINGKKSPGLESFSNEDDFLNLSHLFEIKNRKAFVPSGVNTIFSYADSESDIANFKKITGVSIYPGREGVEFYPQELFLLRHLDKDIKYPNNLVKVGNYQNPKSKHKVAYSERFLEQKYMYPLIKGSSIERFYIPESEFLVPFPYDSSYCDGRKPVPNVTLQEASPRLLTYFNENKHIVENQTDYNDKIIGKKNNSEFYAIARVGKYSHADYYVAFRDNTKWQACVVEPVITSWGEKKHPVFQNHAVSICERPDGTFISLDEAHYICAILNAPIVARFMTLSSDSRSFKIRPPIQIKLYDPTDENHIQLCQLSKTAHLVHNKSEEMANIDLLLDQYYLKTLS